MERYDGEDPNEIGIVELNGQKAIVLVADDSAFQENQPMEVIEGVETVYIIVRRGIIEAAANRMDGEELGREVLEAATSMLATWQVLSQ